MRYHLGSCEYKWSHVDTHVEHIWVRREIGDSVFEQCNQPGFELVYEHKPSVTLPDDVYCSCNIYVDVEDGRQAVLFALKGHLEVQEAAKR